ncbi:hypothetical protein Pint_10437 [Pistacia integerrima]|uniref:Uncharacterized protein n=1 Tax=Pistacia integerrima TaxID=434235 RepID=A0ACC0XIC0_9ROSI|nr:hypothetical protein Pint_10437 [Pistacia integerrima]
MQSAVRFSSCRGVSFEIKPHADPFAITTSAEDERRVSKRFWPLLNQTNSSEVFPTSVINSISGDCSSHFCDLDLDHLNVRDGNAEYDAALEILEAGNNKEKDHNPTFPSSGCILEQPSKAVRKKKSRLSIILLDQVLFTVYKQLFAVCLILNSSLLVLAAMGHFPYAKNRAALFSIVNILVLTLCRSEAFLRIIFGLVVKIFGRENTSPEIIGVASAIFSLLCLSSLAAFPLVRHLHHNVFERIHRFAGWTAFGLLWAFVILTISYDPKTRSYTNELGSRLIKQQEFWFTAAITVLIIIPWLTVRRVPVKVSAPSGHASIIKFEGGVNAGMLGRISPSPLSEWHAFGIISDGKTEHMMLAGAVGDFTKSLVSKPPSHLWVRQVHFAGLPHLINMYDRVLLFATGSGICVLLSFLLQPCRASVCLVWVAKGIAQNFGKEIKQMVNGHPVDKVIVHDTALFGRPNVSQMSVDAAKRWGAEVVIVTSNPEGSRDVVNACKSAGIAAFGPIWDS